MGEVLPITKPLASIRARFIERKWMRAAKAWRCFLTLPEDPMLPSMLTGLIDTKVDITLRGDVNLEIAPAFIVDVPSKGKRFSLVIETCYEQQASLGPLLTALTDTPVTISVEPHTPRQAPQKINADPLTPQELRGLHVGFFRNERFWEYLEAQRCAAGFATNICSEDEAKLAFKSHMGVDSCKDVTRSEFTALVASFNHWVRGDRG
jgi:hypothetical protein